MIIVILVVEASNCVFCMDTCFQSVILPWQFRI